MGNPMLSFTALVLLGVLISPASAQSSSSCPQTLTPTRSIKPSVASGYQAALVATGLTRPRSIQFDRAGNLLIVQSGRGISSLQLEDNGGNCISVRSQKDVIQNRELNHGLALSQDGNILYASTPEAAYSWDYDSAQSTVSEDNRTLVTGMENSDHTTRTLLLSQKEPGMLLISRGSTSNLDVLAEDLSSGHSQLRAFNLTNMTDPYEYSSDGLRLGWGLRNSVGVVEHPDTGGIYSVENSVDEMEREGEEIHENNPGEELNFHGYLNVTEYGPQGSNYGYPSCYAAWMPDEIPDNDNIKVGSQFAIGDQNATINDTYCEEDTTPPRLTFQAHMAPLDIKFNNSATEAWITFRGSWDRSEPIGYKLSMIPFANGEPVAQADNNTSYMDIFTNADNSVCPDNCFRPVGIAIDGQGRLFMSSETSGEIYVISKVQDVNGTSGGNSGGGSGTDSGAEKTWVSNVSGIMLTMFVIYFNS